MKRAYSPTEVQAMHIPSFPFEGEWEAAFGHHFLEGGVVDEMIIDAVFFPGAHFPSRIGNGINKVEFLVIHEELAHRPLADPGGSRNNDKKSALCHI